MSVYAINDRDEALEFCDKLMKFAKSKTFKPIKIEANFGKARSNSQNSYYWLAISEYILPYFLLNPIKLVELVLKGLKFAVTKEFIHEIFKMIYLQGSSTTKSSSTSMADYMESIRHDMFHDYQLLVPEPSADITLPDDLRGK